MSQDNRLYFFQFPSPFPTFLPINSAENENGNPETTPTDETGMAEDTTALGGDQPALKRSKSVSFAPETKPPVPSPSQQKEDSTLDGVIGQLEVYKSGAVKMRLCNGTLLDVGPFYASAKT